jgi:hypothetical protein
MGRRLVEEGDILKKFSISWYKLITILLGDGLSPLYGVGNSGDLIQINKTIGIVSLEYSRKNGLSAAWECVSESFIMRGSSAFSGWEERGQVYV